MTYIDMENFPRVPLVSGRAYDTINRTFAWIGQVGGAANFEAQSEPPISKQSPLEERLRFVRGAISEISMHLPTGFAAGLNRQFANLMDDDAWEDDDQLVDPHALTAFILTLVCTKAKRRPGIGTNGRGSITASWTVPGTIDAVYLRADLDAFDAE